MKQYQIRFTKKPGDIPPEIIKRLTKSMNELKAGKYIIMISDQDCPTESQLRYYFMMLDLVAKETGNDVSDLRDHYEGKHLTRYVVNSLSEPIEHVMSLTQLTMAEMREYITKFKRDVLNDTNVELPDSYKS